MFSFISSRRENRTYNRYKIARVNGLTKLIAGLSNIKEIVGTQKTHKLSYFYIIYSTINIIHVSTETQSHRKYIVMQIINKIFIAMQEFLFEFRVIFGDIDCQSKRASSHTCEKLSLFYTLG